MRTPGSFLSVAVGAGLALVAASQSGAQSTETIRQYQFAASGDGYELVMREVPRPAVGPGEVLVRVHATSLNRRDWYILNESISERGLDYTDNIPLSDGAGGVSSFGLIFAAAAGARPIITSSSNDKLARARQLGAVGTVNYRENEDWQVEVRALTNGYGVDHVLEIGGRDTLEKALEALAFEGHIALIGGVTGAAPPIPVGALMGRGATVSGIYVGSRADFEAMNAFMEEHRIRPVIDRVFSFEQAQEAYDLMGNGSFMGKIVIAI